MNFLINFKEVSIRVSMTLFFLVLSFKIIAQQPILRPKIQDIVTKLKGENTVHFGYPVGESGRRETDNKYYKLYSKLKRKATNDELVSLLKDTSECIVVYAFDILAKREYTEIKTIFLQHQNDTTWFWIAGGCTGMGNQMNWFMLSKLKPKEQGNNFLTEEEYQSFCDKYRQEDEYFTCY